MAHLYRQRRRRTFDIHIPFTLGALVFGALAAALLVLGTALGWPLGHQGWVITGWLALAGWAGTMVQGHLYKIATFLVWLHRYAPLAGTRPLPRLDDLYHRRIALGSAACWSAGVALAALGLAGIGPALVVAGPLLSLGLLGFLTNLAQIARPRPLPQPFTHPSPTR